MVFHKWWHIELLTQCVKCCLTSQYVLSYNVIYVCSTSDRSMLKRRCLNPLHARFLPLVLALGHIRVHWSISIIKGKNVTSHQSLMIELKCKHEIHLNFNSGIYMFESTFSNTAVWTVAVATKASWKTVNNKRLQNVSQHTLQKF